jgi:hypothetical protein
LDYRSQYPLSDKISRYTVKGCDWNEVLALIKKIRTPVGREMKRPLETVCSYEAGYDGFWLHRLLETHGVRNYVVDPASVRLDRPGRRVQTDAVDAAQLLRSLMAYPRRAPKVWSVVHIPELPPDPVDRGPAFLASPTIGRRLGRASAPLARCEFLHDPSTNGGPSPFCTLPERG